MDPIIQVPNPQICNKHNEPILLYDPDPKNGGSCLTCIQQKTGMISAESHLQNMNTIIQQETELSNINTQLFEDWHKNILNHKNSLVKSLDKILKVIVEKIEMNREFKENLKQISSNSIEHQKTITNLLKICEKNQQENEQVKALVKKQLLDIQKKHFNTVDELVNQLNQKPKSAIKEPQIDERRFQYELIKQSCKEEKKDCNAFAFNKESNILVVACEKQIIVYQFNEGVISKEMQRLGDHTEVVEYLYFMKQSNSFVSGSVDNSIIIWEFDMNKKQWFAQNQLKNHTKRALCITMNKSEDLLISGSPDKTIKFWNKINSKWNIQLTITANDEVYDISLNEKENKLISCVKNQVQILEKESDKTWRIVQTIKTNGFRLGFTVEDQFVIQPKCSDGLDVYDYNQSKKQFVKIQDIQIQIYGRDWTGFPCQYIKKLNIVAVKNGIYLNIFKINQFGRYSLFQTIQFKESLLYGRLSDDGEYLVTWDAKSLQIEVRKLKYVE